MRVLITVGFLLVANQLFAQVPGNRQEDVFTIVEKQPEFPGGLKAFVDFLETNLTYPAEAQQANLKGRLVVSFIVNRDGSLEDVRLEDVFALGHGCEEEALRVTKLMPNWIPGSQSGRTMRVRYLQVIWFPASENRKWFLKKP